MKWSPYINAFIAILYICVIVIFTHFIGKIRHDTPDTIFDGIGALSLFVFSAATMGFLFFYQPVIKLIENKKTEALSYFFKMLTTFGILTIIMLILVSMQ